MLSDIISADQVDPVEFGKDDPDVIQAMVMGAGREIGNLYNVPDHVVRDYLKIVLSEA